MPGRGAYGRVARALLALALTGALAACAAGRASPNSALEYHPDTEIPKGRGLLTGKDGHFELYGKDAPGSADPSKPQKVPRQKR